MGYLDDFAKNAHREKKRLDKKDATEKLDDAIS